MSGIVAIVASMLAAVLIGAFGLRMSRTTSDFYVASRTVSPLWNASAIGGEYLSAASFLGVAGLILTYGADMLWLPVGWTGGYLVLLVLVSAPLRRSGAYTLPDFAEARLESMAVRRTSSVLVVLIGWLYLMPQFQSAGLVFRTVTGAPPWAGSLLVAVVVAANVLSGGMRSITFVQAFQYWLKLTALAVPLVFMLIVWWSDGPRTLPPGDPWALPLHGREHPVYETYSLILATFLGTMGLPHVLVRFYTNPDGRAARRTTLVVLSLLGAFYLMPAVYGFLGRVYGLPATDTVVIALPGRLVGGAVGDLLTALVTAGAFAAFLSTSSGLTVSVAGVIAQDLLGGGVRSFRFATVLATVVPLALAGAARSLPVATVVGLAFAVAASSFCPLLVLGIWWRRLTTTGAICGLLVGGGLACAAVLATIVGGPRTGWPEALLAEPAAWTVPVSFTVMVVVSLVTPGRVPRGVARTMVRLHTPDTLNVDRGDWRPRFM
ncbi:sodium/solute symporter [Microbispora sp. ATCC PTA-5024]|uniref:sodium/solute symporter n=1 Tax=Microbispora sp. ATCC PTA-5024 TaxID=316330 RepID=UPI0003DD8F46|nr:cation acetate symporter [Microbispora sp. ATCC PTA-5024]ETK32645.1 transporter [Microbispora sp. ATCC PTA-5024]